MASDDMGLLATMLDFMARDFAPFGSTNIDALKLCSFVAQELVSTSHPISKPLNRSSHSPWPVRHSRYNSCFFGFAAVAFGLKQTQ